MMKTSTLAAAIACTLFLTNVSAQDKPASGMPPMGMSMDKQGPMPMQANMEKMQQQMDKIGATTDPKERQRLMREHMQTMQENMKAMRGMAPAKQKSAERSPATMADKKGIVLTTRKQSFRNKPAQSLNKVTFKNASGPRRVLSKIRTTLRQSHYRKDLKTATLRRAASLLRAQQPKVAKAAAEKKPVAKKAE